MTTELNDEQQRFVHTDASRMILEAPAGSGKTQTVSERVRRLTAEGKSVLVVCFTHSARNTIERRLQSYGMEDVPVRTVVSLAFEALSRLTDAELEVGDGWSIAKDVCARTPTNPKTVLELEALIRNDAPLPHNLHPTALGAYDAYREAKRKLNFLSYVDVVVGAIGLKLDEHYDEIIVDEAQDLTPTQLNFLLGQEADAYTLVGDSGQAIYGFNGVNPQLFSELTRAGWERQSLRLSYRVPSAHLPVVNAVRDEPLEAVHDGGLLEVLECSSTEQRQLINPRLEPGDAVLAPTRSQIERLSSWLPTDRPDLHAVHSWDDDAQPQSDSVHFATIHKAKGGEWNRVYLLDVKSHGLSTHPDSTDDEREKLFYVGTTRSLDHLILCQTGEELPYGVETP